MEFKFYYDDKKDFLIQRDFQKENVILKGSCDQIVSSDQTSFLLKRKALWVCAVYFSVDSGEEDAEAERRFSALQALVVLLPDAHREALKLLLAFVARLARLSYKHQVTVRVPYRTLL